MTEEKYAQIKMIEFKIINEVIEVEVDISIAYNTLIELIEYEIKPSQLTEEKLYQFLEDLYYNYIELPMYNISFNEDDSVTKEIMQELIDKYIIITI